MSSIRFCLAALPLLFCAAVSAEPSLRIEGAWVRALPPTQSNTAAYLTVHKDGAAVAKLVDASAAGADRVEFHTTREVDGYMRMSRLDTLEVAAGESLQLAPGGTHLMLFGLAAMPQPGESVHLCLATAAGGEACFDAPVRRDAGEDVQHHHHHH